MVSFLESLYSGSPFTKSTKFQFRVTFPNDRKIAKNYKSATLLPETKYTGSENKLLQTVGIIQQDTQCNVQS